MYDKINHYVALLNEEIDDVADDFAQARVDKSVFRIADFGCELGYSTLALALLMNGKVIGLDVAVSFINRAIEYCDELKNAVISGQIHITFSPSITITQWSIFYKAVGRFIGFPFNSDDTATVDPVRDVSQYRWR